MKKLLSACCHAPNSSATLRHLEKPFEVWQQVDWVNQSLSGKVQDFTPRTFLLPHTGEWRVTAHRTSKIWAGMIDLGLGISILPD
jgi:hypothetical protein